MAKIHQIFEFVKGLAFISLLSVRGGMVLAGGRRGGKRRAAEGRVEKKSEHISLISWPDARPTYARLQGRLARMHRVSRAVQSPRTPQSPAGLYAASRQDARC